MNPVICNCQAVNDNRARHCRVPPLKTYDANRDGMVVGEVHAAYRCNGRECWLLWQYDGTFMIVNKQRDVDLSNYESGRAVCVEPNGPNGAAIAFCLDTGAMR